MFAFIWRLISRARKHQPIDDSDEAHLGACGVGEIVWVGTENWDETVDGEES